MLLTLDRFIKMFTVRRKDLVLNPPIKELKDFTFPRNSHIHFPDKDGESIGIRPDNPILANVDRAKVICEFPTKYIVDRNGKFRFNDKNMKPVIRPYFREFRTLYDATVAKSDLLLDRNIIVTNYGLMEANVKYNKDRDQWWYRFENRYGSIFQNMEDKIKTGRREHFLFIDIPDLMPSIPQLKKLEESMDMPSIRRIANTPRMLIAQFWLWLAQKEKCLISQDPNVTKRMWFVLKLDTKIIVFNLHTFKTFIKSSESPTGQWDTYRAQRSFVVMGMTLQLGRVDDVLIDENEEQAEVTPETTDYHEALNKDDVSDTDPDEPPEFKEDTGRKEHQHYDQVDITFDFHQSHSSKLDALDKKGADQFHDELKKKLQKAVEKNDDHIFEIDDIDKAERKRNQQADALLRGLDSANANIAAQLELDPESQEDTVVKPDVEEKKVEEVIQPSQSISNEEVDLVKGFDYPEYAPQRVDIHTNFNEKLKEAVIKGKLTPQQMKRMEKLSHRYKEIPDPKTGTSTLEKASIIDKQDLHLSRYEKMIEDHPMVADKSMLASSIAKADRKYTKKVMHKDIYRAVLSAQRRGFTVQNYQIKRVTQLGDDYEVHSVKIVPITGEPSTLSFKVPIIDQNGYFESRGVRMKLIPQRVDIPIRKIAPDEVALTSYISKMFVQRCQFSAYSKERWLRAHLVELGGENNGINVSFGNAFNNEEDTPLAYSQYARICKRIRFKDYDLNFDVNKLTSFFGDEVVKTFNKTRGKQILLGKGKNTLLILTNNGIVHECSVTNTDHVEIGSLDKFIGLDEDKAPKDCADLIVVTKAIPLGFVLAYYIGLGVLLKTMNVNYHFVPKNTRGATNLEGHVSIRFADGTLVVNCANSYKAQLIFQGFNRYHKYIKEYNMVEFDKKNAFDAVLAENGLSGRYGRELMIMRDMWIDPITEEELMKMGEPTDFVMLLLRAVELLEKDQHPNEMERLYQRDRGYERISGMVYDEIVKAMRVHESNPIPSKAKLSINPEAVWMRIVGDDTATPIEESNPIHALKDVEKVVFRGSGGRGSRTMNSASRAFTKSAIGVDSEVTVDNGDAGTVKFLSANPNYNSLRGTTNELDKFDSSVNTTCLNTSTLLAPMAELDD